MRRKFQLLNLILPPMKTRLSRFKEDTIRLKKATTRKLLRAPEPMEAVSSFWNDEFSFKNRTLSSQASIDGSNLVKIDSLKKVKSSKMLLTRRKTGVIGMDRIIHHGTIDMTLNEIKNLFKLRYEHRNEAPLDGIIFKLGIDESCPQIYCNIIDCNRQVGRLIIKKNVLSKLNFHRITMKVINEKPKFKVEIGSKMGLRGWNSIKNILKYGEFQFQVDFSAHKSFDRMRLSDDGIKEFMYGIDGSCTLRYLNINENNITHIGAEIIKNYLPKTKIKELIISHNPLGNAGIQLISKLLNIQNFELEYLDVSSCRFNQIGALNLYTSLNKNYSLTTLLMDDNSLRGPTIKYLTEALWQNKTLRRLSLAKCDLDYDSNVCVFEGIEKNICLHEVNLSENSINSSLSHKIRELLCSSRSILRYLNISDNFVTNDAFEKVAIQSNLKSLVLRNNSLNNIGARSLLIILQDNKNLRRIDISKNRVGVKYMNEINRMIERNRDRIYRETIEGVKTEIVNLQGDVENVTEKNKEIRKLTIIKDNLVIQNRKL